MSIFFSDCQRCLENWCQYIMCACITYMEWYRVHGGPTHFYQFTMKGPL